MVTAVEPLLRYEVLGIDPQDVEEECLGPVEIAKVKAAGGQARAGGKRAIPAGEFRQRCSALRDRGTEKGMPLVVTKRGYPAARVVPIDTPNYSMRRSLRVLTVDEEELYSGGETRGGSTARMILSRDAKIRE